jgi:hypothetical protein
VNEKVEIIYAVSPILLVIEVDPEPGASLAIEDIKRSRLWVSSRRTWFCVSRWSECSLVVRSRVSDAPPHAHSLCDPLLKPKHSDPNGKLANDQTGLPAYKSHSPQGRLPSNRCI